MMVTNMIGSNLSRFVDLLGTFGAGSLGIGLILVGVYVVVMYGATSHILRVLGLLSTACGVLIGAFVLGRATGGAACEAAWQQKQLEAKLARMEQESKAKTAALEQRDEALREINRTSDSTKRELDAYAELAKTFDKCRLATDDDLCRLRAIDAGKPTAGCKPANGVH